MIELLYIVIFNRCFAVFHSHCIRGEDAAMKMYVGVTDFDWYTTLKASDCDEVNF